MSKVITLSQKFPGYHPKSGQPTYFVEKFYNSLFSRNNLMDYPKGLEINEDVLEMKHHTIRSGKRWKVGQFFSPRVWGSDINPKNGRSGPYQSKQIILCPDVLITQVYDFEIKPAYKMLPGDYDCDIILNHRFYKTSDHVIKDLAKNDGLSLAELLQWFKYPKPFVGQVIVWNSKAEY
jgi:hypothetical protein